MAKLSLLLCLTILGIVSVSCSPTKRREKDHKKSPNHSEIRTYELTTENMRANFTNWGATLMSFHLPDKNGKMEDVVLGFDNVDDYKNDTVYFGATVGRVANRIGGAKFTLNGTTYNLVANDGKNTLHGGKPGFSDVVWTMHKYDNKCDHPYVIFAYDSDDGEAGFPGELKVKVTYKLKPKENTMTIKMEARLDSHHQGATPVNLAHHTYWNLGGHNSGDILSHTIQIAGSHITPTDKELIPTGEIKPVKGTPFDFLAPRPIGSKMSQLDNPKGYDINYCLDFPSGDNIESLEKPQVVLEDHKSGRKMEIRSNQGGLQFYSGGQLKDVKGKEGAVYKAFGGVALETQGFPDAVNHDNFPSQIVKPGDTYEHVMSFKFSN